MFSGIVEEAAKVVAIEKSKAPVYLSIKSELDHANTKIGDSISVSGVCLTVVRVENQVLSFELAPENFKKNYT